MTFQSQTGCGRKPIHTNWKYHCGRSDCNACQIYSSQMLHRREYSKQKLKIKFTLESDLPANTRCFVCDNPREKDSEQKWLELDHPKGESGVFCPDCWDYKRKMNPKGQGTVSKTDRASE